MKEEERNQAESIRRQYVSQSESKLSQLQALDRKVKRPAEVFAYVFGLAGALVLGFGMCMAMRVLFDLMPLGIVVGCVGIVMVSLNYPLYRHILERRKARYRDEVLALSDALLHA